MNAIAQLVGDKDITLRLLLEQEPDDVRALALLGSLIETLAKAGFDNSLGLLGFLDEGVQIVHPLSPEATDRAVASTNDFASQGQFNTFKTLLDRLRVLESGAVHQGESVTVLGKCTTFLKSQMLEVFCGGRYLQTICSLSHPYKISWGMSVMQEVTQRPLLTRCDPNSLRLNRSERYALCERFEMDHQD